MCNQRTLVHFLKTDLGMSPREDARVPLTRLFDAAPDPGPRERAIRWRVPDGARAALPRLAEVDAAELLVPSTTAAALTALATLLRPDGGDLAPAQWLACDPRALVRAALEFDVRQVRQQGVEQDGAIEFAEGAVEPAEASPHAGAGQA